DSIWPSDNLIIWPLKHSNGQMVRSPDEPIMRRELRIVTVRTNHPPADASHHPSQIPLARGRSYSQKFPVFSANISPPPKTHPGSSASRLVPEAANGSAQSFRHHSNSALATARRSPQPNPPPAW